MTLKTCEQKCCNKGAYTGTIETFQGPSWNVNNLESDWNTELSLSQASRRHPGVYSALPHQWFSVTRTVSSCVWSYVTSSVKGVLVFAAFPAFPMSFHGHYKTSRPAPSSGSMNLQHVQQGPTAIANLKASQNRANFSTNHNSTMF